MIHDLSLMRFIEESNYIEGITRDVTEDEFRMHKFMLDEDKRRITVHDVTQFVTVVAGAELRDRIGLNVRVGDHIAPPGGPDIKDQLEKILQSVNQKHTNPYTTHVKYETLHPYTDGNGRSGRALWLRMMVNRGWTGGMTFLHTWYYQSLSGARKRSK